MQSFSFDRVPVGGRHPRMTLGPTDGAVHSGEASLWLSLRRWRMEPAPTRRPSTRGGTVASGRMCCPMRTAPERCSTRWPSARSTATGRQGWIASRKAEVARTRVADTDGAFAIGNHGSRRVAGRPIAQKAPLLHTGVGGSHHSVRALGRRAEVPARPAHIAGAGIRHRRFGAVWCAAEKHGPRRSRRAVKKLLRPSVAGAVAASPPARVPTGPADCMHAAAAGRLAEANRARHRQMRITRPPIDRAATSCPAGTRVSRGSAAVVECASRS
jgi:hypothetical protein